MQSLRPNFKSARARLFNGGIPSLPIQNPKILLLLSFLTIDARTPERLIRAGIKFGMNEKPDQSFHSRCYRRRRSYADVIDRLDGGADPVGICGAPS